MFGWRHVRYWNIKLTTSPLHHPTTSQFHNFTLCVLYCLLRMISLTR